MPVGQLKTCRLFDLTPENVSAIKPDSTRLSTIRVIPVVRLNNRYGHPVPLPR